MSSNVIIKQNFDLNLEYFSEHKKASVINDALQIVYVENGNDWIFKFKQQITPELETALDDVLSLNETQPAIDVINTTFGTDLKLSEVMEEDLLFAPFNFIDFKRHLQPPYTLNKVVTKNPDGRPNLAEYFYNDTLMAQITFVFRNFPNSPLMYKRAEILNYILLDGSLSPDIYIKSKTFNLNNSVDLETVVAERETARRNIINGMMGAISGILVQTGYASDSDDASSKAKPFFDLIEQDKQAFISIGTDDLKDFLLNINLTDQAYDYTQGGLYGWISLPLPAPIGSIRNYMAGSITYTTQDTHLDKII